MSTEVFSQLERKRLLDIAREYQEKGYHVEMESSNFPEFLQGHEPDLVVTSNEDNVIVEIVSSQSINNRTRLGQLAETVESMPGWRFELVVTNPRTKTYEDISIEECRNRLWEAHTLYEQRMTISSLLIAWSATEALLRKLANTEKLSRQIRSPVRLVKTLYSLGVLSRSEYESLNKAAQARNTAIHGFEFSENLSSRTTLYELIKIGEQILHRLERQNKMPSGEYTVQELVDWFFANYEDPANGVPYEGEYLYVLGGPYDAWDELSAQFPDAPERLIQEAVDAIHPHGFEWVKRGQY